MSSPSAAVRRKRPANRRELIVDAAASLFADSGFENVAMSDVAAAVGVGPSALYRHFTGKDDLLRAAIEQTLDRFASTLDGPDVLDEVADFAVGRRTAPLLWVREARHLPRPQRLDVVARLDRLCEAFAVATTGDAVGPGARLRARMALAALLSPAFHGTTLPVEEFRSTLVGIAAAVLGTEVEVPPPPLVPPPAGLARGSKREQILRAALRIFADQTYASTGMEEIGEAVGLSTSSVYNHFTSKLEILDVALHRANGYLQVTLDDTLLAAPDEGAALRALAGVYADFTLRHPALVDILVTEVRSLGAQAEPLLQAQRDYVSEWVRLCRAARPALTREQALVTVQATLMAMNDIARDSTFSDVRLLSGPLAAIAVAALGLPEQTSGP
ncbi:TetR/AcrR family transcriptional regulator [Nocardia sp. NPDC051833]|uniref:TetR/AcrR family transcriptional regulator n=1 Tax=Nocardia sp. NPDC051833 TaxID=3155674 RepID=UPI003421E76A